MKGLYTVAEVAALFGLSRRQMRDKLVRDSVIEPRGRGAKQRIPITRLLSAYGEELDALAFAQRLQG